MSDNNKLETQEVNISLLGELIAAQEQAPETSTHDHLKNQEYGDARLFCEMFTGRAVYDHSQKQWYLWNGTHWKPDKVGEVNNFVFRELAAKYIYASAEAIQAGSKDIGDALNKRGQALMTRRRMVNVLQNAAEQPGMRLTGDEWDINPMILPVSNGVIELTTGQHRPARPDEYIRSFAPVDWRGIDEPCPLWEKTLLEIHGGDEEMVSFLQRVYGYAISGLSVEHFLPVLHGPDGRNGKGTEMETIAFVLGEDLAATIPADALMDVKRDGAGTQPYIYGLKGKRLVWASESREGQRFNSGLIKALTGADTITAHSKYTAPIAFRPTHQIVFISNYEPHISGDDNALWERVVKIPFMQSFVDDPLKANQHKRNKDLPDKLKQEASGILAWLVRGFLAWQQEGLNAPAAVRYATGEYRENEDTLGQFSQDCLEFGEGMYANNQQIFNEYRDWCTNNGIDPMTLNSLTRKLKARYELKPHRTGKQRGLMGVGVKL